MQEKEEYSGEELYNLLAELINRKKNRGVLDCIRGGYGVLRYLTYVQDNVNPGILIKQLHVVPGRMTDILTGLEAKGFVTRTRSDQDRRKVFVSITDAGRDEACRKREYLKGEYQEVFEMLGKKDMEELVRLLKIVLSSPEEEK